MVVIYIRAVQNHRSTLVKGWLGTWLSVEAHREERQQVRTEAHGLLIAPICRRSGCSHVLLAETLDLLVDRVQRGDWALWLPRCLAGGREEVAETTTHAFT